jgi:hypothetical protein
VSSFDIPVGLRNLLQWVPSIDDRSQLSRLSELFEEDKIFTLRLGDPADDSLAAVDCSPEFSKNRGKG